MDVNIPLKWWESWVGLDSQMLKPYLQVMNIPMFISMNWIHWDSIPTVFRDTWLKSGFNAHLLKYFKKEKVKILLFRVCMNIYEHMQSINDSDILWTPTATVTTPTYRDFHPVRCLKMGTKPLTWHFIGFNGTWLWFDVIFISIMMIA